MLNKEIFKKPKVTIVIISFLILSTIIILLAIFSYLDNKNKTGYKSEIDPVSGDIISTSGGGSYNTTIDRPLILGVKELLNKGISSDVLQDLNKSIIEYFKNNNIKTSRISYYKGSYRKISNDTDANLINSVKISINNQQSDIYAKIITKGISNYEIRLYKDEALSDEIHSFSYCSVLICKPEAPTNNRAYPTN